MEPENSDPPPAPSGDEPIYHDPPPEVRHVGLIAVVFEGGLAIVACAAGWLFGFNPLQTLPASWDDVWTGLAIGIAVTLPMIVGLLVINRYPVGPLAELKSVVDDMIIPLFRDVSIAQFAVIAAAAGVGEEILFRGLLQGGLDELLRGSINATSATWTALGVASLLFGLMHPITRMYVVLCVLVGLYLGGLWIVTENLLVPIVAHGAYDFFALVYLVRGEARNVVAT